MRQQNSIEASATIPEEVLGGDGQGDVHHRTRTPGNIHEINREVAETQAKRRASINLPFGLSGIERLARAVKESNLGDRRERLAKKNISIALPTAPRNGRFGREKIGGVFGATKKQAGGDRLALMSRVTRRTLLPSLVLAGFAPAAAAAMGGGGLGAGVAASSAVLSPLLTNRWCEAQPSMRTIEMLVSFLFACYFILPYRRGSISLIPNVLRARKWRHVPTHTFPCWPA